MKLSFTADIAVGARFESVFDRYTDVFEEYFANKNYGDGIAEICLCAVCRPRGPKFKQRVRMDHKEKVFYCDIVYDYDYWVEADTVGREADFFTGFRQIIPFLEKRKYKDFNVAAFVKDLEELLGEYI